MNLDMGQLGVLGRLAVFGPDLSQIQSRTHDCVHFLKINVVTEQLTHIDAEEMIRTTHLSPGSGSGEPEPGRVDGDAGHGGGGHEVAHGVRPPGVVVLLVHQVLPGHQLEEEHARADEGRDDRPARNEEVARVVADHVIQGQSETPMV